MLRIKGKVVPKDYKTFVNKSIQLNSSLVAEARGNHPISPYSANQIASF